MGERGVSSGRLFSGGGQEWMLRWGDHSCPGVSPLTIRLSPSPVSIMSLDMQKSDYRGDVGGENLLPGRS